MISTQAQYEYARQQAALKGINPENVRFEVRDRNIEGRRYDIQIGAKEPYTEIKAGKTITGPQLRIDINAAQNGTQIDYRFAKNPVTGNHGPSPADARRLANANAATNGNLTSALTDVGPTSGQIKALEAASTVSHLARQFGRVAGPVGIAGDVIAITTGMVADGGVGQKTAEAAAGSAGGWAGAAAGGWIGVKAGAEGGLVFGGPVGMAVGAVGGGLVGAGLGGYFGGELAEEAVRRASSAAPSPRPMIGTPAGAIDGNVFGD